MARRHLSTVPVAAGHCRLCGLPVVKSDGALNRRRWWHRGEPWETRNCIDEYLMSMQPGYVRSKVFARDKGVCVVCGVYDWDEWEADHIVPLADGGSFSLDNLQTLCPEHHKEKTARENSQRSRGLVG